MRLSTVALLVPLIAALAAGCASNNGPGGSSPGTSSGSGCGQAFVRAIPALASTGADLSASAPIRVGFSVLPPGGPYVVTDARLAILPVGTNPDGVTTLNAFLTGTLPTISVQRTASLAAGASYTTVFAGTDQNGDTLPAGRYPVYYYVVTSGAPGSACAHRNVASFFGPLMYIDWSR